VSIEERLGAISVAFLGDDSELNNAVATKFAAAIGYNLLLTSGVIQQYTGQSVAEAEATEGRDFIVATEVSVIESLATMLRCSIGTLGGGYGGAARHASPRLMHLPLQACSELSPCSRNSLTCCCTFRGAAWRHLHGAYTVWLDMAPEQSADAAPQREAYVQAELHVKVDRELALANAAQAAEARAAAAESADDETKPATTMDGLAESVVGQARAGGVSSQL